MVRGLLPRGLDEASYALAMAIEAAGTPIEAAFWRRQDDDRWLLYLASPVVDASGEIALWKAIREAFARMGGEVPFEETDVRPLGMDDEVLLEVRLEHGAVRGEGVAFTGGLLILWARRTPPEPILTVPLEDEDGGDTKFTLTITPTSMRALRLSVVGFDPRLVWKAVLEFPALGAWRASGEGRIGSPERSPVWLEFAGERVAVVWQRGRGRGYVFRRTVEDALAAYEETNQAALARIGTAA